jgi:hypothetical protein
MKEKSLKLNGRVVSINAADQSVLLESVESSNRLRVYTNNTLFRKLNYILTSSRFTGGKAKEITGTFYIQGKVLMGFSTSSKPAVVRINNLCLETNEDRHSLFDFIRLIRHALDREPSE